VREAIAPFIGTAATKGLALEMEVAADVPAWVRSDPLRLRQVLVNLVGNAVKFTHRGSVRLRVARGAVAALPGCQVGLHFEVIDSGIGIRPDAVPHIFDAFTQADSSTARHYGGTGLGLAIAARLVRLMRGELLVDSQPDQGSRFHFALCVDPVEEVRDPPVADMPAAPLDAAGDLRVLVVEDSPVNQEVVHAMLGYFGVAPQLASGGHQALELVAQQAFDLILMDCMMPGLDGYETVRRIRRLEAELARPPCAIVALTANAGAEDPRLCLDAGMDDFLAKPLSLDDLGRALQRWGRPGTATTR